MKAIIPAAGLGTRFLPETKVIPKELLPVINKPVLQYVLEEANAAPELRGSVIVNSPSKPLIEEYFLRDIELENTLKERGKHQLAELVQYVGDMKLNIIYQHAPLGLGHAVYTASTITNDEPFYVLLADVIVPDHSILPKLYAVSKAHNNCSVIAVIKVSGEEVSRFGIIGGVYAENLLESGIVEARSRNYSAFQEFEPGSVWKIDSLIEKPNRDEAPSNLAIFGRYLLSPKIMDILSHTQKGAGGEIQLTDAMIELLETEEMYAVVIDPREGYDTGTVANLIAANISMAKRDQALYETIQTQVQSQEE